MTTEKDLCPISDIGNHRYFVFKTTEVFEQLFILNPEFVNELGNRQIYEKVEYAILSCNCGSVMRMRVEQK